MSEKINEAVKEQCLRAAGRILAEAMVELLTSDPAEQARRAYLPGGPSLEEIEAGVRRIQAERGLTPEAVTA